MDPNLRDEMDANIEEGKAETEEIRAEVQAQAEEAKADLAAQAEQAEGAVREHFAQVRGDAADELQVASEEANQLGSAVEPGREDLTDRSIQADDQASAPGETGRDTVKEAGQRLASQAREKLDEAKGLFDKVKGKLTRDKR